MNLTLFIRELNSSLHLAITSTSSGGTLRIASAQSASRIKRSSKNTWAHLYGSRFLMTRSLICKASMTSQFVDNLNYSINSLLRQHLFGTIINHSFKWSMMRPSSCSLALKLNENTSHTKISWHHITALGTVSRQRKTRTLSTSMPV